MINKRGVVDFVESASRVCPRNGLSTKRSRSDGARPDGANSGHFNIDRYKTIPINGVPQVAGNMHFGEHNPLFSPAEHIFGEARQ